MYPYTAAVLLSRDQVIFLGLGSLAIGLLIALGYKASVAFIVIAIGFVFFLVPTLHRLSAAWMGGEILAPAELLSDDSLPTYTVLVPLKHEQQIVSELVSYLRLIDYPKEKLEVIIIVEQDDILTLDELQRIRIPEHFRIQRIANVFPHTKARALNLGLRIATGNYLVVYDAEDRPEPMQLRKAASIFSRITDRSIVCLQAAIAFHNEQTNFISRHYAIEYDDWFQNYLPFASKFDICFPLAGNSYHIETAFLKFLGGWDEYNVTEDADLGMRVALNNRKIKMFDSVTYEGCCVTLSSWLRQRTRWHKGLILTQIVYSRGCVKLLRLIGLPNLFVTYSRNWSFVIQAIASTILTLSWFFGSDVSFIIPSSGLDDVLLSVLIFNFTVSSVLDWQIIQRKSLKIQDLLNNLAFWMLLWMATFFGTVELFIAPYRWNKTDNSERFFWEK